MGRTTEKRGAVGEDSGGGLFPVPFRSHSQISSLYLHPQLFFLSSFSFLISVWSFGSVLKSIGYSSRGPGFGSCHLLGGSELSVTPGLGDPVPSSGV